MAVASPHLQNMIAAALNRWPVAGLAVAIVRDGSVERFVGHGLADIAEGRTVSEDSVFRVGSLTKTITAVAIMQLHERHLLDLDAPADDYLRAFRLVPRRSTFGPATVRHLLTHTAGVGYLRRMSDLLHPGIGSGDAARTLVPASEYYRDGLPIDVEPGTRWAYSNHGFAALGQIVEDVTGTPFAAYVREHVFDPIGMARTAFAPSAEMQTHLATGYALGRRGLRPVRHREIPTPAGGGLYSTAADMARFVAALQQGTTSPGRILEPDTVPSLFLPHFQPDPRVPGMGLGFELGDEAGVPTVAKGGTVSGFLSAIEMVPSADVGAVVLCNTGRLDNQGPAEPLASAVVRHLLDLPDDAGLAPVAPRPESWRELCGWYAPDAGPVTNLFQRAIMGAGLEVLVHGRQLVAKPLTPIPVMRGVLALHPHDPDDPKVFRLAVPGYGRWSRVVFTDETPPRMIVDVMSFTKRPDARNPRRWLAGSAAVGAVAAVALASRADGND